MYCGKCGQELREGARYCISCGAQQAAGSEQKEEPVKEEEALRRGAIGGWLLLLIPGLLINAGFSVYLGIEWSKNLQIITHTAFDYLNWFETIYYFVFAVLSILMLGLLFARVKKFPEYLRRFLTAGLVVQFLTVISIDTIFFSEGYTWNNRTGDQLILPPLFFQVIWEQYCKKSKRIRAVFPESPWLMRLDQELSMAGSKKTVVIPQNPEALPAPCPISLVRDGSMLGALVKHSLFLNGQYIGNVKNSDTLFASTPFRQNVLIGQDGMGSSKPFYFDVLGNGPAEIHVRALKFLPKKCRGLRQTGSQE